MSEKIFISEMQEAFLLSLGDAPSRVQLDTHTGVMWATWPDHRQAFIDLDGEVVRWVELEEPLGAVA